MYVFGNDKRKNITLAFLNAVLKPSLERTITDLKFVPAEDSPACDLYDVSRVDAVCILDDMETINVQIQLVNCMDNHQRTIFYWTQLYQKSLKQCGTYQALKPAVIIRILGFKLCTKPDDVSYDTYSICSLKTGRRLNNTMELHFLDIPQYRAERLQNRVPVAEMSSMERWLAYLSNCVSIQEMEELAMADAAIGNAMEASEIILTNKSCNSTYLDNMIAILDYNSEMIANFEKGRKEGIQIVREKAAVQMLIDKIPIEQIQRCTSLSHEKIEQLANEIAEGRAEAIEIIAVRMLKNKFTLEQIQLCTSLSPEKIVQLAKENS